MSPNDQDVEKLNLTPQQQLLLVQTIEQLQAHLTRQILRKLRNWAIVAAGVCTLGGIVGVASLKTSVVDAASNKLAMDARVRDAAVASASAHITEATGLLTKAQKVSSDLDKEMGRISSMLTPTLQEIRGMLTRISSDVAQLSEPTNPAEIHPELP